MIQTFRTSRMFRYLNAIRHEVISRGRMAAARKRGIRYKAIDPGLLRKRVHYDKGSKRYSVAFPNGAETILTVTVERGYEDIDGRAHLPHYLRAIQQAAHFDIAIDCACGSGYGSAFLASRFTRVIGIDIDDAVILYAKERYRLSNLEFICADAGKLTQVDARASLIVSVETMEHVIDDINMVRTFHGLLQQQGILYITVPNSPDQKPTSPFHVREYSVKQFTEILGSVFGEAQVSVVVEPKYVIGVAVKRISPGSG